MVFGELSNQRIGGLHRIWYCVNLRQFSILILQEISFSCHSDDRRKEELNASTLCYRIHVILNSDQAKLVFNKRFKIRELKKTDEEVKFVMQENIVEYSFYGKKSNRLFICLEDWHLVCRLLVMSSVE